MTDIQYAAPVSPVMVDDMRNIELGTSTVANIQGLLCLPCACLGSCWVLEPRTEALVLHYGILTEKHSQAGCHMSNTCGREIRVISTAQVSLDLPSQKINDKIGNPIMVSAVLAFRFTNPVAALLNVQDAHQFVTTQASATLKQVMSQYTYDELKLETSLVSSQMCTVLQPKVLVAGATIYSMTLNELNYAPEIAQAMLKKQAAVAMVEARHLIVKGAVDIAFGALSQLQEKGMKIEEKDQFQLVCNLLIITAGDKEAQPTISI